MKKYAKPISVYIEKNTEGYEIHVSNILNKEISCQIEVKVLNFKTNHCRSILKEIITLNAEISSRTCNLTLGTDELLIADVQSLDETVRAWYKEGLPKLRKAFRIKYSVKADCLEIWSEEYIHAVEVQGVKELDDNYFSLLPEERKQISLDRCESGSKIEVCGYTFE